MQQSGSNTVIIFDTETVFKETPASPASAHVLPFVSETVQLKRNLIKSKTLRGNRNPQKPMRGNVDVGGPIPLELSPQYGKLFKHIFGTYGVAGGPAPYTHTYKVGNLPVGITLEKQFTDLAVPKYFLYNGCKVNNFTLDCKTEGPIDCSVDFMGSRETINDESFDADPTDNGHTPFDGFEGSLKQDGDPLAIVTEISLALGNVLDGNTYVIDGTGERRWLTAGQATASGKIIVLFEDTELYELALANTETSLEFHLTKGLGDGTDGNEKMSFYFDELIFAPNSPSIKGPTGLLVELPIEAYWNRAAEESALRMVLLSPIATF